MSIGLLLKAKLQLGFLNTLARTKKSDRLLPEVEKWVQEHCAELQPTTYLGERDGRPTLFCRLHPAAEDVELAFIEEDLLTASANTSTVGPGYHIFLCDLLHTMGKQFRLQWEPPNDDYQDETGYFHTGNQEKVFAEMTIWLETIAGWFFDGTINDKQNPVRIAMPIDDGFTWNAMAITPLGPRDEDWLKQAAEDGSNGRDFFAWWTPGMNAEYFRGRALAKLWSDVRWRPPINDRETNVLRYVADSLETAHKMDAILEYPWAEWNEILGFLHRDDMDTEFVRHKAEGQKPSIGYRRNNVNVQLPGNWWINLPGSFSLFESDEKSNYFAFDPPREVWVTSYTFNGDLQSLFQKAKDDVKQRTGALVHETEDYVSWAEIKHKSDGAQEWFSLSASCAGIGNRAVCTIIFTKPEEREWAIDVWKSLKPPKNS